MSDKFPPITLTELYKTKRLLAQLVHCRWKRVVFKFLLRVLIRKSDEREKFIRELDELVDLTKKISRKRNRVCIEE